jgi:hypothetical protein
VWDLDNDGSFETTGPVVQSIFASIGNYPIKLRVTDDGTPEQSAITIVNVLITTPPIAPTANADGPYVFCPQAQPWFLDGRLSVNPDDGLSEPGKPADFIKEYAWDLDGDNDFNDAFGPTPNVTAWFVAQGVGDYLIQLRVTDNTAAAFPSSNKPDQTSTSRAQVSVKSGLDPTCQCVVLTATVQNKWVHLNWSGTPVAPYYNVYRGETTGGPYIWQQTVTTASYSDHSGISGQTYYYVVRPAAANGDEICQSNEIEATPRCPLPTAQCLVSTQYGNRAKYYRQLKTAANDCYGRMQMDIYVGDTQSAQLAGPFEDGMVVRIRTGMTPKITDGLYGVASFIDVKGQAFVFAKDPLGQETDPVVLCPLPW